MDFLGIRSTDRRRNQTQAKYKRNQVSTQKAVHPCHLSRTSIAAEERKPMTGDGIQFKDGKILCGRSSGTSPRAGFTYPKNTLRFSTEYILRTVVTIG